MVSDVGYRKMRGGTYLRITDRSGKKKDFFVPRIRLWERQSREYCKGTTLGAFWIKLSMKRRKVSYCLSQEEKFNHRYIFVMKSNLFGEKKKWNRREAISHILAEISDWKKNNIKYAAYIPISLMWPDTKRLSRFMCISMIRKSIKLSLLPASRRTKWGFCFVSLKMNMRSPLWNHKWRKLKADVGDGGDD